MCTVASQVVKLTGLQHTLKIINTEKLYGQTSGYYVCSVQL